MSAVERIDDQDTLIALPRNVAMPGIPAVPKPRADAQPGSPTIQARDGSVRGERLRPLLALVPYLGRYRAKTAAALVALTVASLATLVVPAAVRRMIDFGFTADSVGGIL